MSEEELEFTEEIDGLHPEKLLQLFDELSFTEKWKKVSYGLKQPKDTGAYKWANLQIKRLLAPAAAVVVPILSVLLLIVFASMQPPPTPAVEVQIIEPEPLEELIEPEEIIPPEPIEPPDPVEMDFTPDTSLSQDNSPNKGPEADFSPVPASFDSVAIVKSPVIMKNIYGSRSPGARGTALGRYGGGAGTEGAVLRALRWLKKSQATDGSWGKNKTAMTSLALLTYLAHGETPVSEEFGATVEAAIRFIVDDQTAEGRFKSKDGHEYTVPIAAYALAEAYGLTKVPQLKYAAEKAVDVVIKGQNAKGGFNYNLKGPADTRSDSSYMSWCCQALKAAKMAGLENAGLKTAIAKAIDGWKGNYGSKNDYGGFGYTGPSSTHGLMGAGALSLQLLGAAKLPEVRNTIPNIQNWGFDWDEPKGRSPTYYWYYMTQAMFHEGGSVWKDWNAKMAPALMKNQQIIPQAIEDPDGKLQDIGFWISPAGHEHRDPGKGEGGGFVQDTCLYALQLMVYYRYLPTFQTPEAVVVEEREIGADDDIQIDIKI